MLYLYNTFLISIPWAPCGARFQFQNRKVRWTGQSLHLHCRKLSSKSDVGEVWAVLKMKKCFAKNEETHGASRVGSTPATGDLAAAHLPRRISRKNLRRICPISFRFPSALHSLNSHVTGCVIKYRNLYLLCTLACLLLVLRSEGRNLHGMVIPSRNRLVVQLQPRQWPNWLEYSSLI